VLEHVGSEAVADVAAFAVGADQAADHLRRGGGAAGVDQEGFGGRGAEVAGGAVVAEERLVLVGHEARRSRLPLPMIVIVPSSTSTEASRSEASSLTRMPVAGSSRYEQLNHHDLSPPDWA